MYFLNLQILECCPWYQIDQQNDILSLIKPPGIFQIGLKKIETVYSVQAPPEKAKNSQTDETQARQMNQQPDRWTNSQTDEPTARQANKSLWQIICTGALKRGDRRGRENGAEISFSLLFFTSAKNIVKETRMREERSQRYLVYRGQDSFWVDSTEAKEMIDAYFVNSVVCFRPLLAPSFFL